MDSGSPTITGNDPGFDGTKINHGGKAGLPLPRPGHSQYIQIAFNQPFEVRSLLLDTEPRTDGSCDFAASDDGRNFHTVRSFLSHAQGGGETFALPDTTARFYRLIYNEATSSIGRLEVPILRLSPAARIDHYRAKSQTPGVGLKNTSVEMKDDLFDQYVPVAVSDDAVVPLDKTVDLTSHFHDGKLDWDVPAGHWTVLRFGYTTTGATNQPAPQEGTGLECDKLSRQGAEWCWNGLVPKLAKELGPLMGSEFTHMLIDSYEVGEQNWTPKFREEFRKRRGYDLFPYLPALTGRVVESPEKSERFLWDLRHTITDLFTENYGDEFTRMTHAWGMTSEVEPYGMCPSDDLAYARSVDSVMGEFWWPDASDWPPASGMPTVKLAASIAHTYGKNIVGAESFTSHFGGWQMSPPTMKALGDHAFCNGCNSFTFHRYAMQPWLNRWPGMTMSLYGSTLERSMASRVRRAASRLRRGAISPKTVRCFLRG